MEESERKDTIPQIEETPIILIKISTTNRTPNSFIPSSFYRVLKRVLRERERERERFWVLGNEVEISSLKELWLIYQLPQANVAFLQLFGNDTEGTKQRTFCPSMFRWWLFVG